MPLPDKSRYLMLHALFNQGPAKESKRLPKSLTVS